MPAGRPTDYTVELGELICAELAEGKSLITITNAPDMPAYRTVMYWIIRHNEFMQSYTQAREKQADALIDKGLAEMDEAIDKDATIIATRKAETRLKFAEKMHPKKYGNKLELSGSLEMKMTDEQLDHQLAQLLGKAGIVSPARGEGAPPEEA